MAVSPLDQENTLVGESAKTGEVADAQSVPAEDGHVDPAHQILEQSAALQWLKQGGGPVCSQEADVVEEAEQAHEPPQPAASAEAVEEMQEGLDSGNSRAEVPLPTACFINKQGAEGEPILEEQEVSASEPSGGMQDGTTTSEATFATPAASTRKQRTLGCC
jgi:hypothetical protein